jgi:hypothetical protein
VSAIVYTTLTQHSTHSHHLLLRLLVWLGRFLVPGFLVWPCCDDSQGTNIWLYFPSVHRFIIYHLLKVGRCAFFIGFFVRFFFPLQEMCTVQYIYVTLEDHQLVIYK